MIQVVAKMMAKIGKQAEVRRLAKELAERSAAEAGNISYTLSVSRTNPRQYVFIECWRDQAAMDIHGRTEHFTGILPKLRALCDGELTIEVFDEVS